MRAPLILGAMAMALVAGCSSSAGHQGASASQVLTVVPAARTTACSAVPKEAVARVFGAPVTKAVELPGRRGQSGQTTCVVEVRGQAYTALAVHLWHGKGFAAQWQDELALTGDDALKEQPYGVEAYGGTQGVQTTVAVRERGFAVRIQCGPSVAHPDKALGVAACVGLLGPLSDRL